MRRFLIVTAIVVVVAWLAVRFIMTESGGAQGEREWFVSNLQYEFTARVDSVTFLRGNSGPGTVWGRLISGNPNVEREDSLNTHLKKFKWLQMIAHRAGDTIAFNAIGSERFSRGDSVWVNSHENTIQFFRSGKQISADPISVFLEGRGSIFTH